MRELRAGLDAQLSASGEAPYTGPDTPAALLAACAAAVLRADASGERPQRTATRAVVRASLDSIVQRAPGNALEVRVPPFGAVQCLPGPRHTRGTPPSVVETDPATWIALAAGQLSWGEARSSHRVDASGVRADLGPYLPLW